MSTPEMKGGIAYVTKGGHRFATLLADDLQTLRAENDRLTKANAQQASTIGVLISNSDHLRAEIERLKASVESHGRLAHDAAIESANLREENDRLIEQSHQNDIAALTEINGLVGQRYEAIAANRELVEALECIMNEYDSRAIDFSGDILWAKHEDKEAIIRAREFIAKHKAAQPDAFDELGKTFDKARETPEYKQEIAALAEPPSAPTFRYFSHAIHGIIRTSEAPRGSGRTSDENSLRSNRYHSR